MKKRSKYRKKEVRERLVGGPEEVSEGVDGQAGAASYSSRAVRSRFAKLVNAGTSYHSLAGAFEPEGGHST